MANRPIYHSISSAPFYETINVDFQFFSGFSVTQKQKSIESLHNEYMHLYPHRQLLEISSKSQNNLGVSLSAFNLEITTTKRTFSVECAFQSSKVFEKGGPYSDILEKTSRDAKKDIRLHESGKLISFRYFKTEFPLEPKDFFYNWLYINALNLNSQLRTEILSYDSFSDIEFNPQKSINCQARAAAIFVGLSKNNLLNKALASHDNFLNIIYNGKATPDSFTQLSFDLNSTQN